MIDPMHCVEAENDVKKYFENSFIDNIKNNKGQVMKELVCVNPKELKSIELLYSNIGLKYGGHIKDLINQLNREKEINEQLKKDNLLMNEITELKLKNKDIEYTSKENILKKDIEYMKEKYEHELVKKELEFFKKESKIISLNNKNMVGFQ